MSPLSPLYTAATSVGAQVTTSDTIDWRVSLTELRVGKHIHNICVYVKPDVDGGGAREIYMKLLFRWTSRGLFSWEKRLLGCLYSNLSISSIPIDTCLTGWILIR